MNVEELVAVLAEARELLARGGNDFAWSPWNDQAAALEEIDGAIAEVRSGRTPREALDLLFAPTGAIQEVSVSSGWGGEFLRVAERYDRVIQTGEGPS